MPVAATTNLQTLATNATLQRTEFDSGTFVEALREKLVVVRAGRRNDIPRHQGTVMRWQYMGQPTAATSVLGEGVDATSDDIDATAVTATIATYGKFFELSDIFEIATISGTRQEFVKAAGHQAALTLDTLALTALASATSTDNAGTALKASDLNGAASYLSGGDCEDHPLAGPGRWLGIFSSEAIHDLVNEGTPTYYQAQPGAFNPGAMERVDAGRVIHDVKLVMSTNIIRATAASPDDDQNYVLAKDAFGVTSLASNILKPEVLIVPASPSLASPLGMRSTIGWKARFASTIIHNVRLKEVLTDATGVGA